MALDMNDPKYKADLKEVQDKVRQTKADAYDMIRYFVDGSFDARTSGHKDIASAVEYTVKSTDKKIEKAVTAFEKRWPD